MSIHKTGRYSTKYSAFQPLLAPLYNVRHLALHRYGPLNTGIGSNINGLRHGRGWGSRWAGPTLRQAVGTELDQIQGYTPPAAPENIMKSRRYDRYAKKQIRLRAS